MQGGGKKVRDHGFIWDLPMGMQGERMREEKTEREKTQLTLEIERKFNNSVIIN